MEEDEFVAVVAVNEEAEEEEEEVVIHLDTVELLNEDFEDDNMAGAKSKP